MRVRAFAKINLSLRVLGVRSDGYHELRTVFQSVALHDTLTIREWAGPFALTCNDPRCPTDRRNLVWRAAEAVWKVAGRSARSRGRGAPPGLSIHVSKRIPMDAGFGGGSSDAVAVIRALPPLAPISPTSSKEEPCSVSSAAICCFRSSTIRRRGLCSRSPRVASVRQKRFHGSTPIALSDRGASGPG